MRHRIPVIAITLLALAGLSAPASAGAHAGHVRSCSIGAGPYHLKSNAADTLGLTYHGVGNQPTVAPQIGDTALECDSSNFGNNTYVLHNDAGNCIRMTDASNDYNVVEESGCNLKDTNYVFAGIPAGTGHVQLQNLHFAQYLGTEHCPPGNGDLVEGVGTGGGTCITWILAST